MARIFRKYVLHCNGIDPFVTLMGNFDWEPISCNNTPYAVLSLIHASYYIFLLLLKNLGTGKFILHPKAAVNLLTAYQVIKTV